jgi:hypothetical protein
MLRKYWQIIGSVGIAIAVAGCNQQRATVATSPNPSQSPTSLAAPKEVLMTEFQQINGTPYLYAPIYVATEERKSILKQLKSGSYDDRKDWTGIDIRNYMFVHRDNLSASKLLSNNNTRLLSMEQIGEPAPPSKTEPNRSWIKKVTMLWYVKATADPNGDQVLDDAHSERLRQQIAISDVSGANYTEILKDIDKIILVYPKGINRRLVIYTSGNKRFVADIDLPKRQATVKELPSIN